ncbi:MAG: four helix bundle protein [Bacteroidales bacterium]|nr:four helix bundle protein [Bacteroidales bacterium]
MRTHEDLDLWQLSMTFVTEIYSLTDAFPVSERYGLTAQLRRAAVSVPSNIAEGSAHQSARELIRYLYIALGSLAEIETQLGIAKRLGYFTDSYELKTQSFRIKRMTIKLIQSLRNRQNNP